MIPKSWKDKPIYLTYAGVLFEEVSFFMGDCFSINSEFRLKFINYSKSKYFSFKIEKIFDHEFRSVSNSKSLFWY